ncbi:MAG: ABC transporter substrate-binding protein [Bryobacteraceae bacterium]
MHSDLISIDGVTQRSVPGLAERWSASKDGTRYVLHLRRGVKFSDGTPFTASDVLFSWSVYLDPAVGSPQRDLLVIDGQPIRAVQTDAETVEFILPKPYAAAERLFDSIAILPRHRLETAWKAGKLAEQWTANADPASIAGLGPFRLKAYHPGEAVVLERNPYYWRKGASGESLPYLDGIEFRLLADEDTQLARFVAGELDVLGRLNLKAAGYLEKQGARIIDLGAGLEYNFLCFNLSPGHPKMAWFGSRDFRNALSQAVDREGLVRVAYDGRGVPLWGPVSPGNRLWYDAALPRPARSVAAARQLLRQAGFRWNSSGRLEDISGQPVELSILVSASSAERVRMATVLQADFRELGIGVTVAQLEFRSLLDRVLKTRQFDTVLLGLGGADPDPNPEMNVWLSSGGMHLWNPGQARPAAEWEAEIDRLMRQQMYTIEPAARKKLYHRVQRILAAEQPMIFLASPNIVVARSGRVGNFRPALFGHHVLWNSQELFLQGSAAPHP